MGARDAFRSLEASWNLPVILVLISGGALDISSVKDLPQVAGIFWMGYLSRVIGCYRAYNHL